MSSERPRTPPRSEFGRDSSSSFTALTAASTAVSEDTKPSAEYAPRLLDIIYLLRDATRVTPKNIPSIFLGGEAVDSSVLLGNGASFSASLQRIPEGPKRIEVTSNFTGWSITKSIPAASRPEYVVYKVARISFARDGQPLPEYRRALENFLTELHALTYPPLFQHKNIVDFLGFAWGSSPFSPVHRLPAIIVEYAQHGTLADLLHKTQLDYWTKHILCLDVARGLSAVHQASLVHGDVKADNVLIFVGEDRKYVGKIADFGYSIVESTESAEAWMGGTRPWKAPESRRPLPVRSLSSTDIYSLGLLIWLVSIDGGNPFDLIVDPQAQGASRADEIEGLKQNDTLLMIAQKKDWLRVFLVKRLGSQLEVIVKRLTRTSPNTPSDSTLDSLTTQYPTIRKTLLNRLANNIYQEKLMRSLDDIFDHSLRTDPGMRDLDVLVSLLESDESQRTEPEAKIAVEQPESPKKITISNNSNETKHFTLTPAKPTVSEDEKTKAMLKPREHAEFQLRIREEKQDTASVSTDAGTQEVEEKSSIAPLPSWSRRGYKRHWMSWQRTRDLEPSVQNFIFDSFPVTDGPELFTLSALCMNGYGCEANTEEALRCLQKAADLYEHNSRAYMHRIFAACGKGDGDDNPGTKFLEDYAKIGSRVAFEDLEKTGPKEKVDIVDRWLRDTSGGVGAVWYKTDEMLHGLTQSQWIKDDWTFEQIKNADSLPNLVINRRGDTVLHFVASCGRWKPFQSLIVDHGMDINLRNPLGETPLLCACRSGHGGIAILCLQRYKANASIAASNGETPLHWLSSFLDQYIEPVTQDLITNGAKVDATTHESIVHSQFNGTIDMDVKLPGTPLSWAVHNNRPHIVKTLLKHGADPNGSPKEQEMGMSPVLHAAYYHHDRCLRLMIEDLEGKVTQKTSDGKPDLRHALMYGPVVIAAVHAADKFSMILRNGGTYLTALHSTLDLLREKTQYINFQSQVGGSLLYYAVSEAHDEVVEYMFEKDWRVETLNDHCGVDCRTPLLEAIRWNRRSMYQTLLDHGADVHALAANPFQPDLLNWSALHIFAHGGHNKDVSLVKNLIAVGLPVDGSLDAPATTSQKPTSSSVKALSSGISTLTINNDSTPVLPCETPFTVAVRHNAFRLASTLLSLGANPNALTLSSGLVLSPYPVTVLGHVIVSNARYSSARLRYLLDHNDPGIDFIVEPTRQLSALHRAAMAYQGLQKVHGGALRRGEFDFDTNADIMHELLLQWKGKKELDCKCGVHGDTALHLAIEAGNLGGVDSLVRAGASSSIENEDGETAMQLAERLAGTSKESEAILRRLI